MEKKSTLFNLQILKTEDLIMLLLRENHKLLKLDLLTCSPKEVQNIKRNLESIISELETRKV